MNQKPKRQHSIETSALPDGHAVLFSKETEWAYVLTPLAALVWEFCDGTNSVADIIANIEAIPEMKVTPATKGEIDQLLEEMDDGGFFEEEI